MWRQGSFPFPAQPQPASAPMTSLGLGNKGMLTEGIIAPQDELSGNSCGLGCGKVGSLQIG